VGAGIKNHLPDRGLGQRTISTPAVTATERKDGYGAIIAAETAKANPKRTTVGVAIVSLAAALARLRMLAMKAIATN